VHDEHQAMREVLASAVHHLDDPVRRRASVATLVAAERAGRPITAAASALLSTAVATAYDHGWQPLDVAHIAAQAASARAARLVATVICAHAASSGAADRAPVPWMEQLVSLEAGRTSSTADPVAAWRGREAGSGPAQWEDVLRLLSVLLGLSAITELIDPPSRWGRPGSVRIDPGAVGEPRALARIRALLAKAESTTFPAEAEALAAKAQELMTRYSVDAVLVEDGRPDGLGEQVRSRRVRIDDPYARPKAQLFFAIAAANGVRGVLHPEYRMVSAVGLAVDLDLTEILLTSLLVQAHRAMLVLGTADTAARGRAFRRGFLSAYAVRIAERLERAREATEAGLREERGVALLPVLARRQEAVDRTYGELFPHTRRMRSSRVDGRGWRAGVAAADRADLGTATRQRRLTG